MRDNTSFRDRAEQREVVEQPLRSDPRYASLVKRLPIP
jgi:hypothetical protein